MAMKKPRTDIQVEERLWYVLKARAALSGVTLQQLTDKALSEWLTTQPSISELEGKLLKQCS